MATFHFELVSPEKLVFSGEVDQVDVPGAEGDFGVLAGHAPLVATAAAGHPDGLRRRRAARKIVVLGGFAEVGPDGLTVLADVATSVEDLDRAVLQKQIGEDGAGHQRDGARVRSSIARSPSSITSRRWIRTCKARRCIEAIASGRNGKRGLSRPRFVFCGSELLRELRERLHDPLVDLALERHDQVGKILHRLPAPVDEFRLVAAARSLRCRSRCPCR